MDLKTGRIFATREDALAAGVPEGDLFQVPRLPGEASAADAIHTFVRERARVASHAPVREQGKRERIRRLKQQLRQAKDADPKRQEIEDALWTLGVYE